jgi:hypothetical protein
MFKVAVAYAAVGWQLINQQSESYFARGRRIG